MEYQTDSDDSMVIAVVQAISEHKGIHPEELEPLYNSIEPDALESLLAADSDVVVQFEYAGEIVIVGPNRIELDDTEYTMEQLSEDS